MNTFRICWKDNGTGFWVDVDADSSQQAIWHIAIDVGRARSSDVSFVSCSQLTENRR